MALVTAVAVLDGGIRIGLILSRNLEPRPGDSLCCSGVCLTVVSAWACYVELEAWQVSLSLSNLGCSSRFDVFNIEPSLKLSSSLHGHIISGHIVSVVKLDTARALGACLALKFLYPAWLGATLKSLASVCIDGVALTLTNVNSLCFSIHLIRFSIARTAYSSFCYNKEFNLE
ncbi:MAG: hypothetical protein AAI946_00040 [Candidatus Hodgkinia cicadicola]